jgi:HEPN domain-containing protein
LGELSLDLAEGHLASARILLGARRSNGAAGMAYQAVDAAIACLITSINGHDRFTHRERWYRAVELGITSIPRLERLWAARNLGFYRNVRSGQDRRDLDLGEARWAVREASRVISRVRAHPTERP